MSLFVILSACGGGTNKTSDGGSTDQKPTVTDFAASPAAVPYGGGDVTLSWKMSGASSLTLSGATGSVAGKTSVSVHVTSDETFTLTAKNSAGTTTATTSVTVATSINVSGHAVTTDGAPLPNATVLVLGKPKVTSDATGAFTVPDVTPPYTLALVDPANANRAVIFVGLTAVTPTIGGVSPSGAGITAISGTVTGGVTPYSGAKNVQVSFAFDGGFDRTTAAADGTYLIPVSVPPGQTQLEGQLAALEDCNPGGACSPYFGGFGVKDSVTLVSGTQLTGQNVTLGAVGAGTLTGMSVPPTGYSLLLTEPAITLPGGHVLVLAKSMSPWTFQVPLIVGVRYNIFSAASASPSLSFAGFGPFTAGQSAISLELSAPPVASVPNGGSASTLGWTGPDASYVVSVTDGTPNKWMFYTADSSVKLPDLSPLGAALTFVSGATYAQSFIAFTPKKTVEESAVKGVQGYLPKSYGNNFTLEESLKTSFVFTP